MRRKRHTDKDIEAAIAYAEIKGWRIEMRNGHAWGRMYCPFNDSQCRCGDFCVASIWSTPRSAGNHARQICRIVDNCSGGRDDAGEDGHES
ncbi:hypothetical protein SAMN04488490_3906 [Marinobacter sp. LV10R510-11A]|uniref:hypothetical protein n=1 Tax=Marinobacter sp. LV10R510-11A TaxID=1415568 RepID=UPI000BB71EB4|nr:hypothetical protein [Marinobacter sp. LV10R510-11A]SOB78060.1 hypothetical protein SAMN04488490_3906 [Marinobacter sp. LV10R510-11A]